MQRNPDTGLPIDVPGPEVLWQYYEEQNAKYAAKITAWSVAAAYVVGGAVGFLAGYALGAWLGWP